MAIKVCGLNWGSNGASKLFPVLLNVHRVEPPFRRIDFKGVTNLHFFGLHQ